MITALIPARYGSKRLPQKNFKLFLGKPLVEWAIKTALKCKYIDKIIVSTDYEKFEYDHPLVQVQYRPNTLSGDSILIDEVIKFCREMYEIEGTIILLQPTSPLRKVKHLNESIELFEAYKKNVISVNKNTYKPNGIVYVFNTIKIYRTPVYLYKMDGKYSVDIDYEHDFVIAESLMLERDNIT